MNNMELYNKFAEVPESAKKPIGAGRLRGFTDINPMWRIRELTEAFGACGFGWYYTVDKQWLEAGDNETAAFCNITLYVKFGDEWSKGIQGTGGSKFVAREKNGLYTSDECFKMALTDALSVACKSLGIGANVYWQNGRSKYNETMPEKANPTRGELLRQIAETGIDSRYVDASCWKRYGKTLAELGNEQLSEVVTLLKQGGNNASA